MAIMRQEKPSALQSIVAGGTAGGIESLTTYPTEYVKTKQQLASKNGGVRSPLNILITTIKNNGVRPLYTGASVFCLSNASKSAVRFATFDTVRGFLPRDSINGKISPLGTMLAGLCAGVAEGVTVLTPGENLKTKLIEGRSHATISQTVSKILANEGISGLYRGVLPVTLKQSANAVVRFTSYQFLLDHINALSRQPHERQSVFAPAIAGGMAGVVTVYATMPFDSIKTKMQSLGGASAYRGTVDCVRTVIKTEGFRSLWKGTTPRLVRLSVAGVISFSIYEHVIAWTNAAREGSFPSRVSNGMEPARI